MAEGYVDRIRGNLVEGWAWWPERPERRSPVALFCDGMLMQVQIADLHRHDLAAAGKGDGAHGFALRIPDQICDGEMHRLEVRILGTDEALVSGALDVVLPRLNSAAWSLPLWYSHVPGTSSSPPRKKWRQSRPANEVFSVLRQRLEHQGALISSLLDVVRATLAPGRAPAPMQPELQGAIVDRTPTILIFAPIPWGYRTQRPQHLAQELTALGYRTLYVEPNFLTASSPTAFDVRWEDGRPPLVRLRCSDEIPLLTSTAIAGSTASDIQDSLRALMSWLNPAGPTVALVQSAAWFGLFPCAGIKTIYDRLDLAAGFSASGPSVIAADARALQDADAVVASANSLMPSSAGHARDAVLIRNACDPDHFRKTALRKRDAKPIAGYVGAIAEWFDVDLLCAVARQCPNVEFRLVGHLDSQNAHSLALEPNISLLGERAYSEIPDLLADFDVTLLPFRRTPLTEHTDPVKAYEYLAAGKPVIAVDLPELEQFGALVTRVRTAEDFAAAIHHSLEDRDTSHVELRRSFAAANSWAHRAAELANVIGDVVGRDNFILLSDDDRLAASAIRRRVAISPRRPLHIHVVGAGLVRIRQLARQYRGTIAYSEAADQPGFGAQIRDVLESSGGKGDWVVISDPQDLFQNFSVPREDSSSDETGLVVIDRSISSRRSGRSGSLRDGVVVLSAALMSKIAVGEYSSPAVLGSHELLTDEVARLGFAARKVRA